MHTYFSQYCQLYAVSVSSIKPAQKAKLCIVGRTRYAVLDDDDDDDDDDDVL